MDLARVIQEVNPSFVEGPELTPAEQENLQALTSPAVLLLGQIKTVLRTYLFNDETTGWVDGWPRSHRAARLEWLNGPEVPVVAAYLAAKEINGSVSGVPGLRLATCDASTANLTWFGHDEPVHLYLTRVVDTAHGSDTRLAVAG